VESLLPPAGSALLITSRNKFVLPGLKEKDLDVLPLDDAKKLLLEIAGRIGEHADELAKLCGCLPLALRNAASALAEKKNLNVADYVERLKDARKRLDLVEASFSLSYELLTPELQRLWSLLSVFPADFDLAGAAAVWDMEPDSAEEALGELVKWSLVDFLSSASGEGGRYHLHDLSRVFAASRLGADAREPAQQRHAEHYQELLRKANELFLRGGDHLSNGLILFDADWTNIQIGQKWAKINAFKSLEIAEICSNFAGTGNVLNLRLHPLRNIEWLEAALVAARKTKNQNAEGVHLGNLGLAYYALGQTDKAIEYHDQALKIAREIGDRRNEGNQLGNLGIAYKDLGQPGKAIEYHEQALKIAREIRDRRGEGADLGNLGNAYKDLGQPGKAIEYHEQALKISREIGDRQGEGAWLFNMSLSLDKLNQSGKAIELAKSALEIF
jgi:tetratricopeptide (TPR) repeat protein